MYEYKLGYKRHNGFWEPKNSWQSVEVGGLQLYYLGIGNRGFTYDLSGISRIG